MSLEVPEFLPSNTYTFERLRELVGLIPRYGQQGVMGAKDFEVVQREAGANLSVDILSGDAWVKGESVARQGIYHQYNNARTNKGTFEEGNASKSRVDQLILAINDSSVIGSSNTPEFVI